MAEFRHLDESKNFGEQHWNVPGLDQRVLIADEDLMVVYVRIPSGTSFPMHQHPEAQIGFQVSGRAEITTDSGSQVLEPGTAYYFAPNEPHGSRVVGDEPVVQIDVFHPVRQEYLEATEATGGGSDTGS